MKSIIPLKDILDDYTDFFTKNEITAEKLGKTLKRVKSKEVKNYLTALSKGSKPEQILREVFFSSNSPLAQHLFKDVFPEVSQEGGFIDYLIKEEREEIALEIKPLFIAIFKKEKSGKIFKKLEKRKLNPADHKTQILKYLGGTRDFVVLTNLEEWYLYSKIASLNQECTPFHKTTLTDLLEDYKSVKDFWHYLDSREDLALKEPLDELFFESLKKWVVELGKVRFIVEDKKKTEIIINFINKFIFIQCLDSFWAIGKNYIREEWRNIERKWTAKNKKRILRKFLDDINEYFYLLYDTELFKIYEVQRTLLDFIDPEEDNLSKFYDKLKLILGIEYGQLIESWTPGIIQYNFRRIDEDILGKSYETFLAEIRKEQGIFYTRKYITQYIVNNTVKVQLLPIEKQFMTQFDLKQYNVCQTLLSNLFSYKILDPACGSGSFLIKALKAIWGIYSNLSEIVELKYSELSNYKGEIVRSKEIENEFQELLKIKKLLGYSDKRKLISKIILRHIHGVDLDSNAIEVAKLNLWLEAIKLAPQEFRFDKVPEDTNHILPNLEMNLCSGDSLVGLPDQVVIEELINNFTYELHRLFEIRKEYLNDPSNIDLVRKIVEIKDRIKKTLNKSFNKFLEECEINQTLLESTLPFYWPLDFWFVYINDILKKEEGKVGFDTIIGNPPYFTIRGKGTGTLVQTYSYNYLQNATHWKEHFRSQSDIYYYFIIRAIQLLKNSGGFGFIIESYWIENDYADRLKYYLLNKTNLKILINFGRAKKIFEDADNDTCILIFEKNETPHPCFRYIYCKKPFSEGNPSQNNEKLMLHIVGNISKENYTDDYLVICSLDQETLGTSKWVLSCKGDILEKLEEGKTLLGDIYDIGQGVVPGRKLEFRISSNSEAKDAGGYWTNIGETFIEVVNLSDGNPYRLESQFVKPLITNSGIKKYSVIESKDFLIYTIPLQEERHSIDDNPGISNYLRVYQNKLESRYDYDGVKYPWYGYQRIQNTEIFERDGEKILCPYRAKENTFALDEVGYFGTTDMYALVPKQDCLINLNYLLGILNSKLLTLWYKEAGKVKGQILEFFATPLSKMPIFIGSEDEQQILSEMVSNIIRLKKIALKYLEFWGNSSIQYRNGTISLRKLALDNKTKIHDGEFDKVWITKINIFPDDENDLLSKKFQEFTIKIEGGTRLVIYGNSNSVEEVLLDLETSISEFRDIIYLEIQQLLASRRKTSTLGDIFSKTEISIIKPNIYEKSFNLLRHTNAIFEDWLNSEERELDLENYTLLYNQIQSLENSIDAYVFNYYNFSESEIEIVLEALETIPSIRRDILKKCRCLM